MCSLLRSTSMLHLIFIVRGYRLDIISKFNKDQSSWIRCWPHLVGCSRPTVWRICSQNTWVQIQCMVRSCFRNKCDQTVNKFANMVADIRAARNSAASGPFQLRDGSLRASTDLAGVSPIGFVLIVTEICFWDHKRVFPII